MARNSGDYHSVEMSTNGTAFSSLICTARASYSRRRNRIDRTCGGDANRVSAVGKPESTLEVTAPYDNTNPDVFTVLDGTDGTILRLTPDTSEGTDATSRLHFVGPFLFEGYGIEMAVDAGIDINFTAVANGDVTINVPA